MNKKKWLMALVSSLIVILVIVIAIGWKSGNTNLASTEAKETTVEDDIKPGPKERKTAENSGVGTGKDGNREKDKEEQKETATVNTEKGETSEPTATVPDADKDDDQGNPTVEGKRKETNKTAKEDKSKNTNHSSTNKNSTRTAEKHAEKSKNEAKNNDGKKSNANGSASTNKSSGSSKNNSKQQTTKPKNDQPKNNSSEADKVTTKTITETETIPFKTIEQNDSSLEKGQTKVVQKGKNGTRTITYKETYKNGKLVSKEQVSSEMTKQPVDKIVKVGTKEAPKVSRPSKSEAESILSAGGLTKQGDTYVYAFKQELGTDLSVRVGSNGVIDLAYTGKHYLGWEGDLDLYKELWGEEEGKEVYEFAQKERKKIEKAVRAAADAVYGKGTSQANSLYKKIISSGTYYEGF